MNNNLFVIYVLFACASVYEPAPSGNECYAANAGRGTVACSCENAAINEFRVWLSVLYVVTDFT
jgi:hypothetical protein